jgi:site-specific DNA-methyltransferase (adenine-specific)
VVKPYYEHAGITIYHGDCREILPHVSADVLVTDPPYGIKLRSGMNGRHGECEIVGDENTDLRDDALIVWGDRPALVFGSWKRQRPIATRSVLIWEKGEHVGMGDLSLPWKPNHEEIYVIGDGFSGPRTGSVLHHLAIAGCVGVRTFRFHPTEKPVALMTDLIVKCRGTVVDCFAGSGSTLIAAKELGRRAIGIEIEERYCEIAAKRLSQEVLPFGVAK